MKTTYYYAKIDTGNSGADKWLSGDNPLKQPAVPIYFDKHSEAEYRRVMRKLDTAGKDALRKRTFEGISTQALAFALAQHSGKKRTLMVVIHAGRLWILRPAGDLAFLPAGCDGGKLDSTTKARPVEKLIERSLAEVPAVLAGLPADQYLSRGTFRKIGHWGNLKAVDMVLSRFANIAPDWTAEHWQPAMQTAAQLLECLGSTGLETLVARVLEGAGCFVPARTGGVLPDIDLFAHNDGRRDIAIAGDNSAVLRIPAGGSITVQVKTWPSGSARFKSGAVTYLIGINVHGEGALGPEWLLAAAAQSTPVRNWLLRSLNWLPEQFLKSKQFGLWPSTNRAS